MEEWKSEIVEEWKSGEREDGSWSGEMDRVVGWCSGEVVVAFAEM